MNGIVFAWWRFVIITDEQNCNLWVRYCAIQVFTLATEWNFWNLKLVGVEVIVEVGVESVELKLLEKLEFESELKSTAIQSQYSRCYQTSRLYRSTVDAYFFQTHFFTVFCFDPTDLQVFAHTLRVWRWRVVHSFAPPTCYQFSNVHKNNREEKNPTPYLETGVQTPDRDQIE